MYSDLGMRQLFRLLNQNEGCNQSLITLLFLFTRLPSYLLLSVTLSLFRLLFLLLLLLLRDDSWTPSGHLHIFLLQSNFATLLGELQAAGAARESCVAYFGKTSFWKRYWKSWDLLFRVDVRHLPFERTIVSGRPPPSSRRP